MSRYKIIKKIGGGGMGTVYKAEDTRLRRTVVLKYLHPELLSDERSKKRFLHEAQAASALDHPNICNIYEIDETPDGRLYISMAYYEGETLTDRLAEGSLSMRESFEIAFSIARGLSGAHSRGVIHRDIKPANVILTREGYIKIVDFGLAKLMGRSRVTQSGTTLGTVAYMSPEQARSEDVDQRADIWSLGVVCYQMVTGKLPFRGEIDQAMIYSILNEDYTPARAVNPSIPEDCSLLIDRCLKKNPEDRYQVIDDVLTDMLAIATRLGWASSIASRTVIPVGRYKSRNIMRRFLASAAAAAVILIGALAVFTWQEARKAGPPLFTTEVRLAVTPLENLTGPLADAFADGLGEVVSHMLEVIARTHRSMWVVPYDYVVYSNVPNPSGEREAFGVNMILTGNVQRYAQGNRLSLELRDATTLEPLRSVDVDYVPGEASASLAPLSAKLAALVDPSHQPSRDLDVYAPSHPGAVYSYIEGVGLLQKGNDPSCIDGAIRALEASVAADSVFAPARCALGWACWRKFGDTRDESWITRARDHLAASAGLAPGYLQPRIYTGRLNSELDDTEAAIKAYLEALKIAPGNPEACRRLSDCYRKQKRLDEAEAVLRSAILRHPDFFWVHMRLGLHYYHLELNDEAITPLAKTLELAPHNSPAMNTLGAVYYNKGQWALARELFERSVRLWPSCQTYSNVGLMLYYEGRFEESADNYKLALQWCDSTSHYAWGNWASALYWVEGQREFAREIFIKAVDLAEQELENTPDEPGLISRLINYYTLRNDETSTRAWIKRAGRHAENNADVMYSIGCALEMFDERETALRYLGEALRHGYPKAIIVGTPSLKDLVKDDRFTRLISDESASADSDI